MADFAKLINDANRSISFNPTFVPAIIDGTKTQTRRFKLTHYGAGELLHVRTKKNQSRIQSPAIVRVVKLDDEETPWMHFWSAMTDEWAVAEGFENRHEFFEWMKNNYKDQIINGETWLYMTAFELVTVNPQWERDNPR